MRTKTQKNISRVLTVCLVSSDILTLFVNMIQLYSKDTFEQLCQYYKVKNGGNRILICHISYSKESALLNALRQIMENSITLKDGRICLRKLKHSLKSHKYWGGGGVMMNI